MKVREFIARSVFFLSFLLSLNTAAGAIRLPMEHQTLTVSVYNEADVSFETLQRAEVVSSRIFERSGIHIVWLNCVVVKTAGTDRKCARNVLNGFLQVHIGHHSLTLPDSVLGISYLDANGVGSQADVFYEELRSLNPDIHAQPAVMLGHVMAHEIGHLLLGTNSHSSLGIMRAQWHKQEIARASSGMLIFDELQSQRMVTRLGEALVGINCPDVLPQEIMVEKTR